MSSRRLAALCTFVMVALATVLGTTSAAWGQDDEPEAVGGVIRDAEREPIEGVEIIVSDTGDAEVGTATTDAEGAWNVELPAPGTYRIQLVVESLPEGAELRNPDNNPLEIDIPPSTRRVVLFPIGEGVGGAAFTDKFVQQFVNGIKNGLIIAITAVGLSLIFGTTGLINFAHGEVVSFGAITAWFLNSAGPRLHIVWAGLLALVAGGALGGALERGIFRPLRKRKVGLFQLLVITIGMSLLFQNILLIWYGGRPRPYAQYVGQKSLEFGPITIVPRDVVVLGMSLAVLLGVAFMLQRTRIGKAMRAVSDNRDLAESSGIDVQRVILFVWVLGAALAALGGVFTGLIVAVDFLMGFRLLLLMFAGVILGGLGTAYGAIVGSLVVGLVTELSTVWFRPEIKIVWALAVLIIVLLVRPQGILGRRERIG